MKYFEINLGSVVQDRVNGSAQEGLIECTEERDTQKSQGCYSPADSALVHGNILLVCPTC